VLALVSDFDETAWWGSCVQSFHEEQKQLVYASRMGLLASWYGAHPPTFNLGGRQVIDIGGGPVSLLLKGENFHHAVVADPGEWPQWVLDRYRAHGVDYWLAKGETLTGGPFDEAWLYNVLTHTDDPAEVVARARALARQIRLFEWIDMEPYPGHPQRLTRELLDEWLGATGFVAELNESGAVGRAYYGVFRTT
jgi:hypothetical protein